MLNKIIETFFTKKTTKNCITILGRKRDIAKREFLLKKEDKHEVKTCLSEFFCNLKGLNVKEREKFYKQTFNVLYNRQESLKSVDSYR